jgi:hypothetical protein
MAATAQQISADAQSCIDLVKAARYADAIAPCEAAMKDSASMANADVQAAYQEAKDEVSAAAQKAAVDAAAAGMAGDDAGDAAMGALKGFGGSK